MRTVHSIAELQQSLSSSSRVFVPTMGALHTGHAELMRVGKTIAADSGQLIVSIFVNPLQFGSTEDFSKYPRTEISDRDLAAGSGVDLMWLPSSDELLASDMLKLKSPEFGDSLEGVHRPGHFDGMLTAVNRLFEIVNPTHAIFGVKDLQQLILIREMALERFPDLEIIAVETVRDDFGLALSSRNKYLSASEIQIAAQINKALNVAALTADPAASFVTNLEKAGIEAGAIDYAEVISMPESCLDLGRQRLVVAVRIGSTRLLDNIALNYGELCC
jgi:pantoate--beta-alanine ligase